MNKIYTCKSCGKVLKNEEDFAGNNIGDEFCKECTDEHGYQKRYSQILLETQEFLVEQLSISEEEAEKMAVENVAKMPIWAQREKLMNAKQKIVITDVGSTTTKALLLTKNNENKFVFNSLQSASTTVEKPFEDVNIGVFNAVRKLEKDADISILAVEAIPTKLKFDDETLYISTSSAGGGLQILVIGLTMFDSAGSGKRCAYGAGGVILDTFAIDDKRSSLEQMQAMAVLHPDIILMAGGVDGGAVASILRLGEILQLASPKPKFGEKDEIPLVFAGNKDAQAFVAGLFQKKFDLYLVPNIRPTLEEENLQPAREKIHRLFMENVMEQAPGYAKLKSCVADDIIPTPTGVIRALQLVSERLDENVMAVDIGGATTDVFSNIMGEYFRTVSANYGMSYSISNVQKDAGMEQIFHWLPSNIDKKYTRNFIANKMLYPTFIARNSTQIAIEQAIARNAISMSKVQHMEMNFNTKQIGFLDKLKSTRDDLEKITEAFYFEQALEEKKFHMHDINILIGSGGILAHTDNNEQALAMVYDGFRPEGITEIWKDRYFISPHMGKLSAVNEKLAARMLSKDCFDKIGIAIRPIAKKWKENVTIMAIQIDEESYQIKVGDVLYFPNETGEQRTIQIQMEKGFYLKPELHNFKFNSDLPIFIDAAVKLDFSIENKQMKMFDFNSEMTFLHDDFISFTQRKKIETGTQYHKVGLPYEGSILVQDGQKVTEDTIIGENLFDPPKVYVVSLFDKSYLHLNPDNVAEAIRIKEGEEVKHGQRIAEIGKGTFIEEFQFQHFYLDSPVRGRVEKINYDSGTIIMREIQDYTSKPKKLNVAKMLNVKPKHIMPYLKKSLNDFVYAGDLIASKIIDLGDSKHPMFVTAPNTGTIKKIDKEKGTVTIQYDREPYQRSAGMKGNVHSIDAGRSVTISYEGSTLNGIIGFGGESWGDLNFIEEMSEINNCSKNQIVIIPAKIDLDFLKKAELQKVKGVVAASIDNEDLVAFIGEEIGVALTGNESIPFPLIITEGFGDFEMFADYVHFFQKQNGKFIYINGHTQIRAGVTRPKMIVMD
jgi:uncharacterized protein (TIGR01319 family)